MRLPRVMIAAMVLLSAPVMARGACPEGSHEVSVEGKLVCSPPDSHPMLAIGIVPLLAGVVGATPQRAKGPAAGPSARLTPVRAYLRAADIPPRGIGAYGVVAFRARPTAATRNAMLMTCEAFKAYLPKQSLLPPSVGLDQQMLTIWPLDAPEAPEAQADSCPFVIDHYDQYAGLSAITDAEAQGAAVSGPGPFLIGWSPSSARGVPDRLVLVVNMAGYRSQDQFNEAFHFWQEKVIQNPAMWRRGFSLEQVRLAIRQFADQYGATLLPSVSLFHSTPK